MIYEWTKKQNEAFNELNKRLCEAPIYTLPNGVEDVEVISDDWGIGIGCVLIERAKVISYTYMQLKEHEKNYPNHDLELVIVVHAMKIRRHYLYDTMYKLFSYHKSLQYLFSQKELNLRQRWYIELFKDYKCDIAYHHGKANVVSDA